MADRLLQAHVGASWLPGWKHVWSRGTATRCHVELRTTCSVACELQRWSAHAGRSAVPFVPVLFQLVLPLIAPLSLGKPLLSNALSIDHVQLQKRTAPQSSCTHPCSEAPARGALAAEQLPQVAARPLPWRGEALRGVAHCLHDVTCVTRCWPLAALCCCLYGAPWLPCAMFCDAPHVSHDPVRLTALHRVDRGTPCRASHVNGFSELRAAAPWSCPHSWTGVPLSDLSHGA